MGDRKDATLSYAGIDGCRGGWIMVAAHGAAASFELELSIRARFADLDLAGITLTAVDMPIGLAGASARTCDTLARVHLPALAKSSVFPAPPRAALRFTDWASANAWAKRECGKGISLQSWYIAGKIRELAEYMTPRRQRRIREAHPEIAFHRLNGGTALPSKKLKAGQRARLDLLRAVGFGAIEGLLSSLPRQEAQRDDALDAAILAYLAREIARGQARRAPPCDSEVVRDDRGLRMEIWF